MQKISKTSQPNVYILPCTNKVKAEQFKVFRSQKAVLDLIAETHTWYRKYLQDEFSHVIMAPQVDHVIFDNARFVTLALKQ